MGDLSYDQVGEILRLVERIDCDEMTLEWAGLRIHVVHNGENLAVPAPVDRAFEDSAPDMTAHPSANAAVGVSPGTADAPHTDVAPHAPPETEGCLSVTAPMMGTFYRSPAPGEKSFVDVGDIVEAGQPLGIIEVMKLMNHLSSEVSGRVARIDVEDAQLVEYGEPIMWIEPLS
jgi:acetyl-CoA carboxylase biotin carboxyl carrier protein